MGFINCRIIPGKKPAVLSFSTSKSEFDFHIFHARYSMYAAPKICMINLILGSAEYRTELNKVQIFITIKKPAVMPRLNLKLFLKPRRAALLMDNRLFAPGV